MSDFECQCWVFVAHRIIVVEITQSRKSDHITAKQFLVRGHMEMYTNILKLNKFLYNDMSSMSYHCKQDGDHRVLPSQMEKSGYKKLNDYTLPCSALTLHLLLSAYSVTEMLKNKMQ